MNDQPMSEDYITDGDERPTQWIGFDLDGTLAIYDGWHGVNHIGEPIPSMVALLKRYLRAGAKVKIFTARVAHAATKRLATAVIHEWLAKQGIPELEVTCRKDYGMTKLYDDLAVAVVQNLGIRA